jgi:hypothetical protein
MTEHGIALVEVSSHALVSNPEPECLLPTETRAL